MPNSKKPLYDEIMSQIIKEKGGTPEDYRKLLDYIAFHETGGTMDPTTIQKSDNKSGIGPGRGKYQFEGEDGSNRLLTSANRTANYYKKLGEPVPEVIQRIQSKEIYDATQLHPEVQDMLVLGDLRMKGGLDLKDYVDGKLSPEDLWVDHWWAGSQESRPQQREKFVKDMKRYDARLQDPQSEQVEVASEKPIKNQHNSDFTQFPNIFKYGGNFYSNGGSTNNIKSLNNIDENLITEFNEGGSHEQNPLGGIPQGQDNEGVPNRVEEGEVKINIGSEDYILPIRNGEMVTKDILEEFKLPTKYAGKPLADIAKKLTAQYKESNNFIDKETAQEELEKLKNINEIIKIEKLKQEQLNPDSGLELDIEPSNEFFLGGNVQQGNPSVMGGVASGAASGVLSGATAGTSFGPIGMIAGGAIGAITGGITGGIIGGKAKKEQEKLANINTHRTREQYRQYKSGGNMKNNKINFYSGGGGINWLDVFNNINNVNNPNIDLKSQFTTPGVTREQTERRTPQTVANAGIEKYSPSLFSDDILSIPKPNSPRTNNTDGDEDKNTTFDDIKDTVTGAMRYASPINNLMQLTSMKKPKFEPSTKIDRRYDPSLFDEQSIVNLNREAAGNTRRALHESSGGNAGGLSSNLIASQIAEAKGLSEGMMKGEDINRQEKAREQEFNLGIDQFNTQIDMADKEGFRKDKAAYSSNKSRLQSALATDLSNISLEEMRKKYPEMMGLDYSRKGDFIVGTDKNGNIISRIHEDKVPKKETR